MSTSLMEFLVELDEKRSLEAIHSCYMHRSSLIFKTEASPQMIKATIESCSDRKVILQTEPENAEIKQGVDVSMKFNIGTEIYFVKAPLNKFMNKYYFDLNSKVIQLKRRKESRYQIPKKWTQAAIIFTGQSTVRSIKCNVHDISKSGIRFELLSEMPWVKVEDILKIHFQIYKRAEISCSAIVRFVLNRPGHNMILGLEFAQLKDVHQEKINSIVEDLIHYMSTTKS